LRRFLLPLILAAAIWLGAKYVWNPKPDEVAQPYTPAAAYESLAVSERPKEERTSPFSCDGRTHCSQMTSCVEAEYFLRNCPNVEMDGNNDGEPCEQQWCK